MSKLNKTECVNFTLPKSINESLIAYSASSLIPKSRILAKLIEHFINLSEKEQRNIITSATK